MDEPIHLAARRTPRMRWWLDDDAREEPIIARAQLDANTRADGTVVITITGEDVAAISALDPKLQATVAHALSREAVRRG